MKNKTKITTGWYKSIIVNSIFLFATVFTITSVFGQTSDAKALNAFKAHTNSQFNNTASPGDACKLEAKLVILNGSLNGQFTINGTNYPITFKIPLNEENWGAGLDYQVEIAGTTAELIISIPAEADEPGGTGNERSLIIKVAGVNSLSRCSMDGIILLDGMVNKNVTITAMANPLTKPQANNDSINAANEKMKKIWADKNKGANDPMIVAKKYIESYINGDYDSQIKLTINENNPNKSVTDYFTKLTANPYQNEEFKKLNVDKNTRESFFKYMGRNNESLKEYMSLSPTDKAKSKEQSKRSFVDAKARFVTNSDMEFRSENYVIAKGVFTLIEKGGSQRTLSLGLIKINEKWFVSSLK